MQSLAGVVSQQTEIAQTRMDAGPLADETHAFTENRERCWSEKRFLARKTGRARTRTVAQAFVLSGETAGEKMD